LSVQALRLWADVINATEKSELRIKGFRIEYRRDAARTIVAPCVLGHEHEDGERDDNASQHGLA